MQKIIKKITAPLLFLFTGIYFIYLQWAPVFPDPDSFYHTKISMLIGKSGLIRSFPWIKFTSFTQNFTDHHFLYHLLLVPFVKFLQPEIGVKIATTILAWLAILFFYLFLKKFKIRYALIHTLILLSISPFVFRMNLAKTSAISLIIIILVLSLIWQKRYFLLATLSFLYVWTYGGWSLILVLLACQILSEIIIPTMERAPTNFWELLKKDIDWKSFNSIVGGCFAGLVINPYFPHNLYFYWEQVVQIGLFNYQSKIPVGLEWYPFAPLDLLASAAFGFILALLAACSLIFKLAQKQTQLAQEEKNKFQKFFSVFLFASLLGVMTIKSQRFIEYFAPFFIFSSALLINFSLPKNFSLKEFLKKNVEKKIDKFFLIVPIILFIIYFSININQLHKQMTNRFSWNYLKNAAVWLNNNTPTGSLVFHSIWSDSTILFLNNSHNVYVAGLDPTFFYRFNPKLYEEWTHIRNAQVGASLARRLKDDFGASYILIKNEETELLKIVTQNPSLILKYQDGEVKIFEVK